MVRVFMLNPYPHGKIFLASSNNILSCHKKQIHMAYYIMIDDIKQNELG